MLRLENGDFGREEKQKEKQTNENRHKIHAADIKLSNKIFRNFLHF